MNVAALEDDACISECGRFRYWLTRANGYGMFAPAPNPPLVLDMLNPSKADARKNDQSVRKLLAFMRLGGHRGLILLNANAYRATDPRELKRVDDPIGPRNDHVHAIVADLLHREWGTSVPITIAWGKHCEPARARAVAGLWLDRGFRLQSWGRNGDGSPPHPLYLPLTTPLQPWMPSP
jgi:hypothetical protein